MDAFRRVRISAALRTFKHSAQSQKKQPHKVMRNSRRARGLYALSVVLCCCLSAGYAQNAPDLYHGVQIGTREFSRPARPWEFLDAVGKHAALFGSERGRFEAWVYPLKVLRDFDVTFVLNDHRIPASTLVRRLVMHPEGPTLTFASDSFTVNETWLVPPEESGAIIRFEISTWEPLEIEASFIRDFELMWPAGLGGTYMGWDTELHAFSLGEEGRKFAALVGSPYAIAVDREFFSNSYSSTRSAFRLGRVERGSSVQYVFVAGASNGPDEAKKMFQRLAANPGEFFAVARKYYDDYVSRTLSLDLPDPQLQAAYDWSRISVIQGLVTNPFLGTGLIAGYGTSGETARPGFAWFFGRDSLWTDLALDSIGDFNTARTALDFIAKFQRQDGKIEHEVSQTASMVDWWKQFRYGFASADATPLFIIAMNDYVTQSGDTTFARDRWDNVWRAYQFLKSTYDAAGLPRNFGVGHGWVEGGPLLPVETESYQSGLAAEALDSLASLARAAGKTQEAETAAKEFDVQRKKVNEAFWDGHERTLVFALDKDSKQVPTPTVLSTAPMWFDVFDSEHANATIDHLANWDHSTDWGMRIISEQNPLFGPTGYHFGSVWPLFTGWAAVGEYRYHRPLEAYANLRANSLLALDGPLGHVTEVLSGSYYEGLGTASPQQIWSSAMVVSPVVRGLLGISVDEARKTVHFAPHIPADWKSFAVHNLTACGGTYDIAFRRDAHSVSFKLSGAGSPCTFEISPAFSQRARILGATLNGKKLAYKVQPGSEDQHVTLQLVAPGEAAIQVADDFGLTADEDLPPLGAESGNLKIFHEQWSADHRRLSLLTSGLTGRTYRLRAYGATIASVEGGELKDDNGVQVIEIAIPSDGTARKYVQREVAIRF